MKPSRKLYKAFILSLTFMSFFSGNKTEAGVVTIINNSDVPINMNVITANEGVAYCWKCFDDCFQTGGAQTATIIVPVDAFCGYEHFSVIDAGDGFIGSGKCRNLSVLKNYHVTFSDTTFGTRCESKEI